MTDAINKQADMLAEQIEIALGDKVSMIVSDPALLRTVPGKVSIYIEPPIVQFPTWDDPEVQWKFDIVAGTPTTQAQALILILEALSTLIPEVNMQRAEPATFTLANVGTLAAYQVTCNELEDID